MKGEKQLREDSGVKDIQEKAKRWEHPTYSSLDKAGGENRRKNEEGKRH